MSCKIPPRVEMKSVDYSSGSEEDTTLGFEPIRSQGRQSVRGDSKELSRSRSNNGYGVDDLDADPETGEPEGTATDQPPTDRDPYEVGWENGDADPLCPRSMPAWRKWLIVCITSFGSFCV